MAVRTAGTYLNTVDTPVAQLFKQTFRTPFIEMIRNEVTLLKRFKTEKGFGIKHQWKVVDGSNSSIGPYTEDSDLPAAGQHAVQEAERTWVMNRGVIRATGLARAASKGSDAAFYEALAFEMKYLIPGMRDALNTQMLRAKGRVAFDHSTDGLTVNEGTDSTDADVLAPGLDSIGYIVDDTNVAGGAIAATKASYAANNGTTYALLSRTAAYWKPYVSHNNGTARDLTIALLQDMTANLEDPLAFSSTSRPVPTTISSILTSRINFNQYGNLLQDQRIYQNTMTFDGGFTGLTFEGHPLMAIPAMPAGDMFLLNEEYWRYYILLDFATEEKVVSQDAERWVVKTYSQLICEKPGLNGRLTDLRAS